MSQILETVSFVSGMVCVTAVIIVVTMSIKGCADEDRRAEVQLNAKCIEAGGLWQDASNFRGQCILKQERTP